MANRMGSDHSALAAAMLMDPKAMKKQMANGISFSPCVEPSPSRSRNSEPPASSTPRSCPVAFDTPVQSAKDDAYTMFERKGRKATGVPQPGPKSPGQSEARQLLDPIGFDKTKFERMGPGGPLTDYGESLDLDSRLKRNHHEYEGQGMGNLIERVHNVSQREDRPQKKQKTDAMEDNSDKKAFHGGGGKGGEIGEYMKQKRKEGVAESGVNCIVDLTEGR